MQSHVNQEGRVINIDPEIPGGTPVFSGIRVPIKNLFDYLEEFEVFAVRELELSGIKNGNLMAYCVENNFDVLLTIDKISCTSKILTNIL